MQGFKLLDLDINQYTAELKLNGNVLGYFPLHKNNLMYEEKNKKKITNHKYCPNFAHVGILVLSVLL